MALFIGFIIFLVVSLLTHRVDLQSEDYYKKEINYEEELSAQKNANRFREKIQYTINEDFVVVRIPDSLNTKSVIIDLIRPDDENSDKQYKIEGTKTFLVPLKDLEMGKYNVEIRYSIDDLPCLQKSEIYITK